MARLTVADPSGNWSVKGIQWKELYEGSTITREMYEVLYGCLAKLKDYEDTGLDPGQVQQLK